ncbi:type 1 glutamine amidotransferase [Kytococcus sp. Marseille-QA3725]
MTTPRILVIQHEENCPVGLLGELWAARGLELDVVRAWEGWPQDAAARLEAADGLLVLGGEMGAHDDERFAWLTPTKELLRRAEASGVPQLGTCLGHQLMAVAHGGRVAPNPEGHATGLATMALTPAGRQDAATGGHDGQRIVMWNNDVVVDLPENATVLATSPDGSMGAARYGTHGIGLQGHPEAGPVIFNAWTVDKPSAEQAREDGIDVVEAARRVAAAEDELRDAWTPLAHWFAETVEHRAARR